VQNIEFAGTFYTEDPELISRILGSWARTGPLRSVTKHYAHEMAHDTERFFLHAFLATSPSRPGYFLMTGGMAASPADAETRLRVLLRACEEEGFSVELEYLEVDEEGRPVGEFVLLP
jgi:hypothetical protein